MALNLNGLGEGPKAALSIQEMDIGDVFINSLKTFEVGIENIGAIDCHWKLVPYETPFGAKFSFSKNEGVLNTGFEKRELIRVSFLSDILGEFAETFKFALEGSSEMLTLCFRGHVVAPTFCIDTEVIDFGRVSYKFPVKKEITLTNTSAVDIHYSVRVPGDGRSLQTKEFKFSNESGPVKSGESVPISIEFMPCYPQTYD